MTKNERFVIYGAIGVLYLVVIGLGIFAYNKYNEMKYVIDAVSATGEKAKSVKEKIEQLKDRMK